MTEREAFEAFYTTTDEIDRLFNPRAVALQAWQASRKQALEESVAAAEEVSEVLGGVAEGPFVTEFGKHTHQSMAAGALNAAAAIRSLSTPDTEGGKGC